MEPVDAKRMCGVAQHTVSWNYMQRVSSILMWHIMKPACYANASHCDISEGLMDYEAALKIDSSNEQLKLDAEKIRHIIQTSSS